MISVLCEVTTCVHNENEFCIGVCSAIQIDGCGECLTYKSVLDREDYQTDYWIAKKDATVGKVCRSLEKGNEIIINGIVFYTQSNTNNSEENIYLTHGRTGFRVGSMAGLKDRWDEFITASEETPDVMSLPTEEEINNGD